MNDDERATLLQEIAGGIAGRGLTAPARITLDIVAPLGPLAGAAALFARPFLPHGRWRSYAAALAEPEAWPALQRLLRAADC